MKTRNFLTLFVFVFAIGSAVASEYLVSIDAYSSKIDVPSQEANCVKRGTCSGSGDPCQISFDPDGPLGPLPTQTSTMVDASAPTETSCGVILRHTN